MEGGGGREGGLGCSYREGRGCSEVASVEAGCLLISQSLKKALAAAFSSHWALIGCSHGNAGLQETPIMAPLSASRSRVRSWKRGRTERGGGGGVISLKPVHV